MKSAPTSHRDVPGDAAQHEAMPIDLTVFGPAELARAVVIGVRVSWAVVVGAAAWLLHPRRLGLGESISRSIVRAFEKLGPTLVKVGQLIASAPGLFPKALTDACLSCLDDVPPFALEHVRAAISEDLGLAPEELFDEFDPVPLSAASIAQVHACVLPDGRAAVVKVQRPGIRARMTRDLRILSRIARLLERLSPTMRRAKAVDMIEDLAHVTSQELEPLLEARHQDRFRTIVAGFPDNAAVTVPEIYWGFCGPRTICMERMYGVPLSQFDHARGGDAELLLRRGVKAWVESLLTDGLFHGDVHAGNVWALDDGRLAFLDFGLVGNLAEEWRAVLRDTFLAVMINGDFTRVAHNLRAVGIVNSTTGTDQEIAFRLEVVFGPMLASGIANISLGEMLKSVLSLADTYDAVAARELLLVGKQLLYFERYAKSLAPDWVLAQDLYLVRNIFAEPVAAKAAELGIELPE